MIALKQALTIYHHHKKSFSTFLLAGIGTTVSYLGLFALFWHVLHWNHIAAVTVAFIFAAAFQFFANRKITFKVKEPRVFRQMLKYSTLLIVNYGITVAVLQFSLLFIDNPFVGLILAAGVTSLTGYWLFKHWVFKTTT